jgi:hypothetical protein
VTKAFVFGAGLIVGWLVWGQPFEREQLWYRRSMDTRRGLQHLIGGGSFALGAVGTLAPRLARWTGAEEPEARGLGFRDLAIGVAVYADPRVGFVQRAIVDAGDAFVFARRNAFVSALAVGSAALALYARTRA